MSEKKKRDPAVNFIIDYLHKNYISLRDDDMKTYVDHFRKVLQQLVNLMKEEDSLFKAIFREIVGAGSYYDGLKVGSPEEFDMDVVISLPVNSKELKIVNDGVVPAFTKVEMKRSLELLRQHPKWTETYRHMDAWVDSDGFLLQNKFRQWIEAVVNKALNRLDKIDANVYELTVPDPGDNTKETKYKVSLKKSGPAMTFLITMPGEVQVDVDFVPVIEFVHPQWPPNHVRQLPAALSKRPRWYIVPKPKKTSNQKDGTIWRLAFHEQEREMINNRGVLKPVCRMLKKFRDAKGLNIASYYLKTLFLWEIDEHPEIEFWRMQQVDLFLYMLKSLIKHLRGHSIPYYWDKRYNLLEGMKEITMENIANTVNRVLEEIEKKLPEEPHIIVKHLLPKEEYDFVKNKTFTPATPLSPAAKAGSPSPPQTPATSVETMRASGPVSITNVTEKSQLEINLEDCIAKLDLVTGLVSSLISKINALEVIVSEIREENANFKDELRLARVQSSYK